MMHLIIHMFNTSMIPYISLDQYLNPNLYTIPNMQTMRFFCCSVCILSQCSNAMPKGPEFYMTNCFRAVYVGKIAELILKNLYGTENMLSVAWFCELLSDWSKTFYGSQDLVSDHKFKKSILTHTPTLGQ